MSRSGFRPVERSAEHGFTLVEMLIALAIFGMLTAAGVALLTLTVRTQETSDRLLGQVGALRRTGALLTADLAQAAPRLRRDSNGVRRPAFIGGTGAEPLLLALVRAGWEGESHSSLQRVEYVLREGRLERLAYRQVDGGEGVAVTLLDGVARLRLRYRDEDGAWRPRWDPTDPTELPSAVELIGDTERHGTVRQLFLIEAAR